MNTPPHIGVEDSAGPGEPGASGAPGAPGAPGARPGTASAPAPRDYRLLVPAEGWDRIALDPEVWPRRIAALVERQFRGVDNAPHLKAEMRADLDRRCRSAWEGGGVELYLVSMDIRGIPVAASLLVTLIPRPEGQVKPSLEAMAQGLAVEGRDARVEKMPAGKALVQRYKTPPQPGDGSTYPDTHYDALFDVPNTNSQLLLSFSTPVAPLADVLTELFESVALSLVWRP
ncbi:hypothetical protein GCM10009839_04280 [Catenulispora yoronensis]|uniref:Uncharacterized protein n=1 Tax=Catenulispora yoronensis TaxID=450799 RepID=A0ABP5F4S4_9ACTN